MIGVVGEEFKLLTEWLKFISVGHQVIDPLLYNDTNCNALKVLKELRDYTNVAVCKMEDNENKYSAPY